MITIQELINNGFEDVSLEKNGLGYRLRMDGGLMELAYYVMEEKIRYQTIRSGVTIPLHGVKTIESVREFYCLVTGMYPKTIQ